MCKFYIPVLILISINVNLQYSICAAGKVKLEPLPETPDYKASGTQYEDGGMGPLFDFARSFINTALPGDFPADFVKETISGSGSQDLLQVAQELLKKFKGYVAAIAVGVLFIVTVPIVGVCFCCCRLCDNCGGKRYQAPADDIHCKRRVLACVLFVLTVFTLVGNICTYVSNDRMSTALEKVGGIVENNLDDIDTFLNLTVVQADTIGVKNLRITRDAIVTKLDKDALSEEISGFAVNHLADGALDKMDDRIQSAVKAFDAVSDRTDKASAAYSSMTSSCTASRACSFLPALLQSDPLATSGLSTAQKNEFATFKNNDAVQQVKQEIGYQVRGHLGSTNFAGLKTNVKTSFQTMEEKVVKFVDEIKKFKSEAKDGMNLQSYKDQAKSYTETAQTYDKYRHIGGTVLAAIVTLIASLQFFGMVFGSVGQAWRTAPTERGCVSNSGGNFLIASVAFIFLFSWILMLLTTITFSVGSVLERFVCQPLSPPDFQLLKVADKQFDTSGIFGASIAEVLGDCRDGKAAYEAFHISSKGFDIDEMDTKLQAELTNIDAEMDGAVQGLKGSTLSTGQAVQKATKSLQDLQTVLAAINYAAVDVLMGQLSGLPKTLFQYISTWDHYRRSTRCFELLYRAIICRSLIFMEEIWKKLAEWQTAWNLISRRVTRRLVWFQAVCKGFTVGISRYPGVAQYTLAMENLGSALKDLEKIKDSIGTWQTEFTGSLQTVTSSIGSKTDEITDGFKKEIVDIVKGYVDNAKDAIRNNIGKCTPLWNLYDSIIIVSVCKYIVDAFNGFWFSIGWCLFFFVPSIVVSVKLSKHYRTMRTDEEIQEKQGETNLAYDSSTSGHLFRSNKVGHGDIPDSQY